VLRQSGCGKDQRECRCQNNHPHGLHNRNARDIGAPFVGEHDDLRQCAGTACEQGRGAVPLMNAL
jgi:hypothetical protein